jgi:hypothetical protein
MQKITRSSTAVYNSVHIPLPSHNISYTVHSYLAHNFYDMMLDLELTPLKTVQNAPMR